MNTDTFLGQWKQFKGRIRMLWGRLIDSPSSILAGQKEQRIGLIQQAYGIARDQARIRTRQYLHVPPH
jgi:uncharacterized protein YjbJ (UPF0337 family)